MLQNYQIDKIIESSLLEDITYGDITTDTLIPDTQKSTANLIAKADGVIAGLLIFKKVFHFLDDSISIELYKRDGENVVCGDLIAKIKGNTRDILKGERTALNILQRLSGIATMTYSMVEKISDLNCRIVDTRKTTPGLRILEKYAVKLGGGHNHRFNLSDAVMIKDNHIQAVGSISKAIETARKNIPHTTKIEVEVESIEQLNEALEAKADIIMLDNMTLEMMSAAVKINNKQAILEASGNVTIDKVRSIAETGVDVISCGALTHSVTALDISLKF